MRDGVAMWYCLLSAESIPKMIPVYRNGQLIVAWWHHMVTKIFVSSDSDNGLLPDGTKPLPEQEVPLNIYSVTFVHDYTFEFTTTSPRGQWDNVVICAGKNR